MRLKVRERERETDNEGEYERERSGVGRQLSITRSKQNNSNGLASAPPVCSLACQGLKLSQHRHVADMVKDCFAFCSEINPTLPNYVLLQHFSCCSTT